MIFVIEASSTREIKNRGNGKAKGKVSFCSSKDKEKERGREGEREREKEKKTYFFDKVIPTLLQILYHDYYYHPSSS